MEAPSSDRPSFDGGCCSTPRPRRGALEHRRLGLDASPDIASPTRWLLPNGGGHLGRLRSRLEPSVIPPRCALSKSAARRRSAGGPGQGESGSGLRRTLSTRHRRDSTPNPARRLRAEQQPSSRRMQSESERVGGRCVRGGPSRRIASSPRRPRAPVCSRSAGQANALRGAGEQAAITISPRRSSATLNSSQLYRTMHRGARPLRWRDPDGLGPDRFLPLFPFHPCFKRGGRSGGAAEARWRRRWRRRFATSLALRAALAAPVGWLLAPAAAGGGNILARRPGVPRPRRSPVLRTGPDPFQHRGPPSVAFLRPALFARRAVVLRPAVAGPGGPPCRSRRCPRRPGPPPPGRTPRRADARHAAEFPRSPDNLPAVVNIST